MRINTTIAKCLLAAVFITAVAGIFSHCLIYDLSSISAFTSIEECADIELSDVYNAVAQRRPVAYKSNDIVIVGVDGCSRSQIAQTIEAVDFFQPRAVGIDILFNYPTLSDSELISVLTDCRNIILPLLAEDDKYLGSYFYNMLPEAKYGVVNIGANSVRDVVREFKPLFRTAAGTVDSFAAALAHEASSDSYKKLMERHNETEIIYYPSVVFETLDFSDILYNGELNMSAESQIRDKIVLIGNISDISDEHLTPMQPMSGLHIHAHILQTILDSRYISKTRKPISWLMAAVFCLLFTFLGVWLKCFGLKGDSMVLRIVQFIMIAMFIAIGCIVFVRKGDYVDFAPSLLMIGFGTLALDICMGITDIADAGIRRMRRRKKRRYFAK